MSHKVEIMSMGSNQININGDVVSKTHWEGYSPDGERINLNFYSNGNVGEIRNLKLSDFGYMLNSPFDKEDDEISNVKRYLNPLSNEYKEMLKKNKKTSRTDKTKKNKTSKDDKKTRKKKN